MSLAKLFLYNAIEDIGRSGREAITAFAEGDELRLMLMGLKRFTKVEPLNMKDTRRRIADLVISKNKYSF